MGRRAAEAALLSKPRRRRARSRCRSPSRYFPRTSIGLQRHGPGAPIAISSTSTRSTKADILPRGSSRTFSARNSAPRSSRCVSRPSFEKEILMSTTFWDRLWRSAGIQFVALFLVAYFVYGDQPGVGSSADTVVSFYEGNRTRILIATFIFGMAVLNLLWFAAAI